MISCIVLSAGYSSRFGSPKALAMLNGETVIEHIQRSLLAALIEEIIIVLGNKTDKIEPFVLNHKRVKFVYNKDNNFGQTSSFKCGLKCISPQAKGILLFPVDHPFVCRSTLRAIVEEFHSKKSGIIIPAYKGRKGHPPLFRVELKNEFLKLSNDVGLNTIAKDHKENVNILKVDDQGVVMSFNTKEEFEKLKAQAS
ncbi:MAG: nucleotidyltransferase family protein [Candidatus Omnitrophica bacterium]|nr:nucleotidyltransferase family protein [Candidatus Omnitrophota bacterium]MBU1997223.1 nucleotidyltransferase family protein [Candidatus Omnitrophota bacterium]MBU4333129.1 nucleotidyltransferase family protein [Candidatus Omnitrophota bacterium]